MSSGTSTQESGSSSSASSVGENLQLQPEPANISSLLQIIPYHKLTDLRFISKGAYGTVHRAFHSDWRIPVAVKFFPREHHLLESERKKILKEAEILHKARFSYILPILGICYEEDSIGIVTEYMTSGSLNQLLYEENPSPAIVWPLRFRILYEIGLGVNFLHNLTPPLLHHDLKTPNILLDSEFHVKIADFGLSKWRMLSQTSSNHPTAGGTIIYMPPEMYEPSVKTSRGSVKHDMYSYAIIMWEVLSRKQPYEGATTPMQIMYTVAKGTRPDTSNESLPDDIPYRDVLVSLMQRGWACDPNDRPSFLKCLLELEPIIRSYDDISILEGILQIKRERNNIPISSLPVADTDGGTSGSAGFLPTTQSPSTYCESEEKPPLPPPPRDLLNRNKSEIPAYHIYSPQEPEVGSSIFWTSQQESLCSAWVRPRRKQIVNQMTDACLNQCLDTLISNMMILKEDYEIIKAEPTRTAKVRKLIDTCDIKGELFARIIVQKLIDNRQNDLRPFPAL